jgi:murein DD-endopeptidase MepM/ murein hydrolase activator NlpD
MTYKVKAGDTLSKIAKSLGVTLAALLEVNPKFKANPNKISVGDVLQVPENKPAPAKPTTPVKPTPAPAKPKPPIPLDPETAGLVLGSLSAKYEVGTRGPGTVSTGIGDAGGASYGSYQMTSIPAGGTVKRFIAQANFPFAAAFKDLKPGTSAFTAAWKQCAASQPKEFQACQHAFIEMTHYDPFCAKIKSQDGLDVTKRSFALQNVIWSTAVQHGPGNSIVHAAIGNLHGLSPSDPSYDRKLIVAIYAERGRKNSSGVLVHFARNSAKVQAGVAARFVNEEKDALKMLASET